MHLNNSNEAMIDDSWNFRVDVAPQVNCVNGWAVTGTLNIFFYIFVSSRIKYSFESEV